MTETLPRIAERLRDTILELEEKRGELAELQKQEARDRSTAFMTAQGVSSDTGRRNYADAQVVDLSVDIIDLKAEIQSLMEWKDFYTLLLKHDLLIELHGCPPRTE